MSNLQRTALVTGAAQGLGLATSERLARDGFRVFLADRNEAALAESARRIAADGGDVHPLVVDVTDDVGVAEAITVVADNGSLNLLVNNAGVISRTPAAEIDSRRWEVEMAVNLGY